MAVDPGSNLNEHPALWRGAGACVLFAAVAVVLRGVRWDETWEHAQILAGQVAYPAGHPLALYVHNAFSLQTYIAAGMLSLGAGPVLLCGFRNVLFLLASMLPVYALTATMTRSVLAGLVSALLMMQGILLEFDGSYPTMVWPETYSNGHIGGGVVLLALAALSAGRFRIAFFLVGLIPCIHVGQWPPLAATAALYGVYFLYQEQKRVGARAARWIGTFGLGFGATLLFWLLHRHYTLPLPGNGPFAAGGDTEAVWKGYTALHDPHRRFPPGNGHVVLAGTMLLAWLVAAWGPDHRLRRACLVLAIYTSAVGTLVWGTMAIHAWMGPDIPFLLIAWMPYRLINHIPAIGLALTVALILARWPGRGWCILIPAALVGVLQPLWPLVMGPALHGRYLAGGECVAFALYGVALFSIVPAAGPPLWTRVVLATAPIMPLAMYHHFGAACVVAGVIAGYIVNRVFLSRPRTISRSIRSMAAMVIAVGAIALLWRQFQHRRQLPVAEFSAGVARELAGRDRVLLLAPPDNLLIQATTNLPVLAEVATPSLISYVPEIGPSIDRLYTELYGITFRIPAASAVQGPDWTALWRERSEASWKELSRRYGFTHIIAPAALPLRLPEIFADDGYALYAVGG